MDWGQSEMNSKPRLMITIRFEFLVAPSPLGMGLSLLLLQTFITKVMNPFPCSGCCGVPPRAATSGPTYPFPLLLGVLPAHGSLPKGATWPEVRTLSGDSCIPFLVGEGYEGEAILFQGVTTLKGPPNPEHPIGLAEACVVTVLWLNCSLCLGHSLHSPQGVDSKSILNRPPAHKSHFRASFLRTCPKNTPLLLSLFWLPSDPNYLSLRKEAQPVFLPRS